MSLYIIGIGLDEKDISLKALEALKKCDVAYLENYTSVLTYPLENLKKLVEKEIILANRDLVENKAEQILKESNNKNVAFMVMGDIFSATTHLDLYLRAKELKINVELINGLSILTAVGITGLSLYKFGAVTSIPLENKNIESPYDIFKQNYSLGLHTLFLLDLKPDENKFLILKDALTYLLTTGEKKEDKVITKDSMAVGCARVGTKNQMIKYGKIENLLKIDFGKPPFCLIIPGKLHFVEEEILNLYSGL